MVQYSTPRSLGGSQVPSAHWIKVSAWREIILGIAKEEMGHLMTVQNLLRCLGGPLNLDREDFPGTASSIPFRSDLEPLTRQSLAKYVYAEAPSDWSGAEADEVRVLAEQGTDRSAPIHHVGVLYKTIEDLLSDHDLIKDEDFRGSDVPFQANWDEWGRGYKAGARGNSTKAAMAGTPGCAVASGRRQDQFRGGTPEGRQPGRGQLQRRRRRAVALCPLHPHLPQIPEGRQLGAEAGRCRSIPSCCPKRRTATAARTGAARRSPIPRVGYLGRYFQHRLRSFLL